MILFYDYDIENLPIRIASRDGEIIFIGFPPLSKKRIGSKDWLCKRFRDKTVFAADDSIEQCRNQLAEYLRGELKVLDFPLRAIGTEFQQQVWSALLDLKYGDTKSYSDIAVAIGKPSAVRAVANAVGANPLSIVVPCHRIIGKNDTGGYAWGVDLKERLLKLESL